MNNPLGHTIHKHCINEKRCIEIDYNVFNFINKIN